MRSLELLLPSSTFIWSLRGVSQKCSVGSSPCTYWLIGGYVFITNMIPLHALVLVLMGRFTSRLYVAYSSWYAIGTLASMQVPFVGFQPVSTSEHMAALGIFFTLCIDSGHVLSIFLTAVFGLLQIVAFAQLVRSHLSSKQFKDLLFVAVVLAGILGAVAFAVLTYKGWIAPWTGRFYSLWDTGYAKKYGPRGLLILSQLLTLLQIYPDHRFCIRASTNRLALFFHGSTISRIPVPRRSRSLLPRAQGRARLCHYLQLHG